MPAPEPTPSSDLIQILSIPLAAAVGGFLLWVKNYFQGGKDEEKRVPPGALVSTAVGAAFVDKSAADAVTGLAADVKEIRKLFEEQIEQSVQAQKERVLRDRIEADVKRRLDERDKRDREREDEEGHHRR